MKLLLFGLYLVGICNAGPAMPEKSYGDYYTELVLVFFREYINVKREYIEDPINIADKKIEIPPSILASGHFEIIDFVENGFKGIGATNITVTDRAYITLSIPSLDINTNYDTDILLASRIPIYGNGLAKINFKNLKADLSSGYSLSTFGLMTISDLSLKLSIESATFDLHGVMHNELFSAIISQILNETFTPIINNHSERLCELLSPFLENIINEMFRKDHD